MQLPDRISIDREVLGGRPAVSGTRIPVELVLEYLAAGTSQAELLDQFPTLQAEDILACVEYARRLTHQAHEPALSA